MAKSRHTPKLAPADLHIEWEPGRRPNTQRILDGRMDVTTAHGLDPLNRLLIEGAAQYAPGMPRPQPPTICLMQPHDPVVALALRALWPGTAMLVFQLDRYLAGQCGIALATPPATGEARRTTEVPGAVVDMNPESQTVPPAVADLRIACLPDLPPMRPAAELVLLPIRKDGEAALTLEWLRQARVRLATGGHLLATSNNPRDTWLREQIERIYGNVTLALRTKAGILYSAKKNTPKGIDPEDDDPQRGLQADEAWQKSIEVNLWDERRTFATRYGVFSSDDLDEGSRALLDVLAAEHPADQPITDLLDLGCGWGAMGILAGLRWRPRRVTMIDANARAIALARGNAAYHLEPAGIEHDVRHEANASSLAGEIGGYDCLVTNPPYGTEFRVAELFLKAGMHALRRGGRIWVVAKHNPALVERMQEYFGNVREFSRRGYSVIVAERQQ